MKRVLFAAALVFTVPAGAYAASFSDVPTSDPDYAAIIDVADRGIATGVNGMFDPDRELTRAEATKFVALATKVNCTAYASVEPDFTDTAAAIGLKQYIACMKALGFASGYGDGRFGPQNMVTAPELFKMLYRAAGITVDMSAPPTYADLTDRTLTPYVGRAIASDVYPEPDIYPGSVGAFVHPGPLLRRAVARYVHNFIVQEIEKTGTQPPGGTGEITEQQAITIAKARVSGEVTDVEIEEKFGKTCYVVEIDDDGVETDVIIDIKTGEVLGIKT